MVAEDGSNMDSGFMMLAMFFLGGTLVLAVVLAFVVKNSRGGTIVSVSGRSERKRCKEPTGFGGRSEEFSQWLFSVQEALRTLQPDDPVGYAASFLEGNARRWLISSWGPDGSLRPSSWPEFKTQLSNAFAERDAEEWYRMRLVRTRQSGNLEDYIARFTGSCLLVPTLDELTKVTLFIEGLSDSELRREVRREHPKAMAEVTRAARTAGFTGENCTYVSTPVASASSDVQDQVASQLAAVRNGQQNQIPRGERLSRSEWLSLYRRRLCFKCQKPGHIAANCPSSSPKSQPPVTGRAQALVEVGVLDSSKISNSLLIVRVIAQGMEARALIDCGATHSFVSETWVRKSNIPTYFTGQMTTVTLADGHHQVTPERRTKDQEWRIGDFSWQESMTVIQLQSRYDMVLGKPWLAAHNPNIDFARNTVEIRSRGKTHCLLAAQ